jgi:hypothetical protein
VFLRSRTATLGAISYLLAFIGAFLYPYISHQTFAGLPAVMLAWPWIDFMPSSKMAPVLCALLNAGIIYISLVLLSFGWNRMLRRP